MPLEVCRLILTQALDFVSSQMLRSFETLSGYWKFEGWILQYDEVPNSFTKADQSGSPLRKRKQTPSDDSGLCMDLLLADRHGPAMVTLWGDTVKQFLE